MSLRCQGKTNAILAAMLAAVIAAAQSSADDLPPDLQRELARLEQRMQSIRASIGTVDRAAAELSVRELEQWIREFLTDAELDESSELGKRLRTKATQLRRDLDEFRRKNSTDKPEPNMPPKGVDRRQLEVRTSVDLNNVSFKRDVAPILAGVCVRCHNPMQKSGEFDASTFNGFRSQLTPGKPESSHVLQLVTGKAEPRMPRGGQTRFTREWIEIWTAWIRQGARFDGPDGDAPIASYMVDFERQRRQAVEKMDVAALRALHRNHAKRQLEIVSTAKPAVFIESEHILLHAALQASEAEYASAVAEAAAEELTRQFGIEISARIFRGRLGVNVFDERSDFVAFCKQIAGHEPDAGDRIFVGLQLEHQYAAILVAPGESSDAVIARAVTLAFVQQLGEGKLPPWAAHGFAHHLASILDPKSGKKQAQHQAARLIASGRSPQDLFAERLPWTELEPLAAGFIEFLAQTDRRKLNAFLTAFAQHGQLERAIREQLGTTSDALARSFAAWLAAKPAKKR